MYKRRCHTDDKEYIEIEFSHTDGVDINRSIVLDEESYLTLITGASMILDDALYRDNASIEVSHNIFLTVGTFFGKQL